MSDMLTGVYMGGGGGNNSWVLTIPWLFMNEVKEKVKRGFFFIFRLEKFNRSLNYGGDISFGRRWIFVVSETYYQETSIQR